MKIFQSTAYIVYTDLKARFSSTALGPLWMVATFAVLCTALAIIWAQVYQQNVSDTLPFFSAGLAIWIFMSQVIVNSTTHFLESRDLLLNTLYPPFNITVNMMAHHVINFLFNIVYVIFVFIYFSIETSIVNYFVALFFMIITAIHFLFVGHLLGFLTAKFRDVGALINVIMQPLFFVSPVIFRGDTISTHQWIIQFNPFAYYLDAIRSPLLNELPSNNTLGFLIVMTIVLPFLTHFTRMKFKNKLVFWVN